jgi:hypothetical protein
MPSPLPTPPHATVRGRRFGQYLATVRFAQFLIPAFDQHSIWWPAWRARPWQPASPQLPQRCSEHHTAAILSAGVGWVGGGGGGRVGVGVGVGVGLGIGVWACMRANVCGR